MSALEFRLDNIVYRMNFASSRYHARQLIRHGHITINDRKVSIPSYLLGVDDKVSFKVKSLENENIKTMLEDIKGLTEVPGWMVVDSEKYSGTISSIPNREDVSVSVEEHHIVELYSK